MIPFNPTLNVDEKGRPNGLRADSGRIALVAHADSVDHHGEQDVTCDPECEIIATLVDLMHFAHREGLGFQGLLEAAADHFQEESGGHVFAPGR